MADPASISAQQISTAVQGSVQKALQGRSAVFTQSAHTVGYLPQPPHWVGIIYENAQSQMPPEEAQQIADTVTEASKSLPGIERAEAHVIHGPDYLTIGFRLPDAPVETVI
jgi:hypothetical protein